MLFNTVFVLYLICVGSHGTAVYRAYEDAASTKQKASGFPIVLGLSEPLLEYDRLNGHLLAAGVPKPTEIKPTHALIEQELRLYPRRFFEVANVKQIVCCSNLIQGNIFSAQGAGGLAHIKQKTILLKVSTHRAWLRSIVHHELFHMLDDATQPGGLDPAWKYLNDPSHRNHFRYEMNQANGDSYSNGFVAEYAKTSPCEDMAEVFAALMTEPSLVAYRAARDVVLQRKVDCIKKRLAAFCPEINDAFWASIAKRERSQDERSQAETVKLIDQSHHVVTIFANELLPGIGQYLQGWSVIVQAPLVPAAAQPMSDLSKISIFVGVMLSPCLLILLFGFLTKK